jgi:hypothetical protein
VSNQNIPHDSADAPRWWLSNPQVLAYLELKQIRGELSTLQAQMQAALSLTSVVTKLTERVHQLELVNASSGGRVDVWRRVFDLAWGLMLCAIGAKLWLF